MSSKMSVLKQDNLKKILKDSPESEIVVISRFKSDVIITAKVVGGNPITLVIPAGYPTPLTEQASLQVLADNVDLQRYIKQGLLYLIDPETVSKIHLQEARRLVAKANNSYTPHDDSEDQLTSLDSLLGGQAKAAESSKQEDSNVKEVNAADASLRNEIIMINNFLKTKNFEDARSKIIQLSISNSKEAMESIFAQLTPCKEVSAIKKELADS